MEGEFTQRTSVRPKTTKLTSSLEAYLTIRGQEYLASLGQGQTALNGVEPDVRGAFAPGSGMD